MNKYIKIGIILLLLLGVWFFREQIQIDVLLETVQSKAEEPWTPVLFILVYAVATTIGVPAAILTIAAAPIFGFWLGLLYVILGSNIGCQISYFVAKKMGKDWVLNKLKGISFLETAMKKVEKNPFIFMMYVRLIPLFPFIAVNYISPLLGIKYKTYSVATVLGMLPGTTVYVYLGYTASNIKDNPMGLVVSIGVLVIFTIIVSIIGKKKDEKKNDETVAN